MTKLEQIEKLREKANVSYDEARSALDMADGDLLDAIIYLEKQGKVQAPVNEGHYTSAHTDGGNGANGFEHAEQHRANGESFTDTLNKVGKFCMTLINKGNAANFEVLKDDESKAKFPLTVMALLLIFLPYVTLPLIVLGMVFSYRYRFNGIDSHDEV